MITITELEERLKRGYELTTVNNNGNYESILSYMEHPYIKAACERVDITHIMRNFVTICDKLLEPMTECKLSYDFVEKQYKGEILKNKENDVNCKNGQKEKMISVLGNSLVDSMIILDSKIEIENKNQRLK